MTRNAVAIVLLAALAIRLLIFVIYQPWTSEVLAGSVLLDDASVYHELARCLIEQGSFCDHTFRTPGYPVFVATVYELFGAKPWIVLLLQILVDVLTIAIVFKIGELLFSRRTGLIAATLLAFDPNHVFLASSLLSDGLFLALMTASLYAYLLGLERRRLLPIAAAGVLIGLATLVRPAGQYYMVILAALVLLWTPWRLPQRLLCTLLISMLFVATVSPWLIRNERLFGTLSLSSIQGENLLFTQVTYARAWDDGVPIEEARARFEEEARTLGYVKGGHPFRNEAIAQRIALAYIRDHMATYAVRVGKGALFMYVNLNSSDMAKKLHVEGDAAADELIEANSEGRLIDRFLRSKSIPEIALAAGALAVLLLHYLLFALGVRELTRQRRFFVLALAALTILYFTAISGVIGMARFRLQVTPMYLLIGAAFVDAWLSRRRSAPGLTLQRNGSASQA